MPPSASTMPSATPRVSPAGASWWRCCSASWARSTACATSPTAWPPAKANCGIWACPPLPSAPPWPMPTRIAPARLFEDLFYRMLEVGPQSGPTVWRPAQVPLQEQAAVDRRHHHRTMRLGLRLGAVPPHQGRRQAASDARSRRPAALLRGHHRRQAARSHRHSPVGVRSPAPSWSSIAATPTTTGSSG